MAETLKQEILDEVAKIPGVDKKEDYRFYLNLANLVARYAGALRESYNEERLSYLEKTVLKMFRNAKTLDPKTGKIVPLDYEGEWYDMDTVVDAVRVDTYHDGEVDADLTAYQIKNGKLYFHAVSYHLDDWIELDPWSTRKVDAIIKNTISSAEGFAGYFWIPDKAFMWHDNIVTMVVPKGVSSIGERAFFECIRMKEIQLPDSIKTIGESAFCGCRALVGIRIPTGVSEIAEDTFGSCSSLSEVNLPDSLTKIGDGAFNLCSSLGNIRIPYGVTEIGDRSFEGCFKLSAIDIPGSVKRIRQYAFRQCSSLREINIPEGVTEIGNGAFQSCSELSVIHIPSSVVKIGANAFDECPNLNKVIISLENTVFDSRDNCNAIIETKTGTLIQGCNQAFIPQGVSKIADNAFSGLTGITEIHIPKGVTYIGDKAFFHCSRLTEVHIPDSVGHIGEEAFKGCPVIPEGTTHIEDLWFLGVEFPKVVIPSSVTEIGAEAFAWCRNIKTITVSPKNKTYDSREDCNAIVETASNVLIVGCENTVIPESVTEIGDGAFAQCMGLVEVTIPKSVTKIGRGAFYNCIGLSRIIIAESTVEVGESAFEGCRNLVSLLAPEGLNLKAAKVPRRRGCSIITRYSPKRQLQTLKRFAITMPSGESIPVEYNESVDGRISVTNWPVILETTSVLRQDEVEDVLTDYDYGSFPFFVLSVVDVLKGGYDRMPDVLPSMDIISDKKLRDELLHILTPVLDTLCEREREIFELYYGIGCRRMTLTAIGAKLDLTEERVRQMKEKAYRKVKMYCPYAGNLEVLKRMKDERAVRMERKMNETHEERVRRISEKKTQGAERKRDDKAKE